MAQENSAPELPVIGQAYGGGFVTGITRDPENGVRRLHIAAGAEHELTGAWGQYGERIQGADSFTDSRANTEAMAIAGSRVAQLVLALEVDGFTGWAIPARDVLELLYRNFKPTADANGQYTRSGDNPSSEPVGRLYSEDDPAQTAYAGFGESEPEAFQARIYWSSTQRSALSAFGQHFADGGQNSYDGKDDKFRIRPVRSEIVP